MNKPQLLLIRASVACFAFLAMVTGGTAEPPSDRLKVKLPETAVIPAETGSDYRLATNDVVHIKVFQEENLETTARVARNGTITIPLIKSATIGGLTRQEAEQRIESLFREYLVKPQVTVRIVEYTKRRITVLGQVNDPGAIELPAEGSVDVLEAIGMAGGYARSANPAKITLKRKVDGKDTIYKLDGKKMANEASSSRFEVLPGDTISVGERIF
jgi:polysaccharide export outer membrane protein